MDEDKLSPKEAAAARLKASLERIRSAQAKNGQDFPDGGKGGKGAKPNTPKGRIFRHQGR